ncbi:hypothetical protein DAEQUDRAFT_373274 [Daedalea quercina L-15889]|uniref:Uncharacterized protein n=1 Tax=Daedalea quercina L-15889 TaxID=1314783 RepID=A0A165P6F8_9APHY|nr:hypothetical protein DAEQUDRAFT_373274 [Daedalea quercina L-15889]
MFSTNGVYVRSLRGSIWQLGIPSDWPSTVPNTIACRSIGPASASNAFGSNGLYYREQQENIWRVELPNSWAPPQLYNITKQSGGSSNEATDLKPVLVKQRSKPEVRSGEQRNVEEGSCIIQTIVCGLS